MALSPLGKGRLVFAICKIGKKKYNSFLFYRYPLNPIIFLSFLPVVATPHPTGREDENIISRLKAGSDNFAHSRLMGSTLASLMLEVLKMKGIIFDFNGTLFWDNPIHEAGWKKYAKQKLNIEISTDFYYKKIHGSTNAIIYQTLYGKPIPKELNGIFGEEKEVYYRNICKENKDKLSLAPGAVEFLNYLKENDIPRAIATSSEIGNVTFFKEIFPLHRWFDDENIIYDDGSVRGKPFPDLYLKAGKSLGIDMKDIAIVEDANAGILAAKSSGAGKVIGIAPYGEDKFLGAENTDFIIQNFYELAEKNLFK